MKSTPSHMEVLKRLVLPARCPRTLLVVSECLKHRAFHIRTVYVSSLDPNGIVWRSGNPHGFVRYLAWAVGLFTKVCAGRINYLKLSCFLHYPLTI